MLANGDFEIVTDGKPAYWEKFGGTMLAEGGAVRGSYAGCLHSETASTKWLYQVIQVDEGDWYEATAFGRVAGPGAVSIRVSWYASSDGSGSQMDQAESNVSSGSGWANLATGAIQAPIGSNSARVRLVLRPDGSATGCFDDARFDGTEPAPVAARATAVPGSPDQPAATQPNANRPAIGATERPVGPGPNVAPLPVLTFAAGGPGAIRISEIMSDPDPAGRDAAYEWVELVNISAEPVDLAGWKLGDGSEQQTLSAFVVPASGYVVIGGASAILRAGVVVLASPGGEVGNGLGNDGDQVILIAPNGEVADEMSYGTNTKIFDPAPKAPGKGATIGVRDPAADPASENWGLTLRPTPGEPNAFPAPAKSTVVGGKTANPGVDDSDGSRVESASGGGPGAPWMVLMGAAGISAGVIGVKYGPRLRAVIKRR